jgi:hypothetical protein
MSKDKSNPLSAIGHFAERVSKIKLRGGVVGKLSTVLVVTACSMAVIAYAAANAWVSAAALLMLFTSVMWLGTRIINFADANPQAALFEGAELLAHEKLTLGMKGHPQVTVNPATNTTNPLSPPETFPPSFLELQDPPVGLIEQGRE